MDPETTSPELAGHLLDPETPLPELAGHLLDPETPSPELAGRLLDPETPHPELASPLLDLATARPELAGPLWEVAGVERMAGCGLMVWSAVPMGGKVYLRLRASYSAFWIYDKKNRAGCSWVSLVRMWGWVGGVVGFWVRGWNGVTLECLPACICGGPAA